MTLGWFDRWFGEEKIFKFVYMPKRGYNKKILLVTARDTVGAVKKFYKIAGLGDVSEILEFTEIKYGSGDVENEG